jgi:class 3 adenylate cyclase
LKTDEATKFSPVVMVTALESEADKMEAINAGADDFISKPFTALMMLTRVKNLLRIKRLHDEVEERNRLLRQILSRYVNDQLTETILAEPEKNLKLGGETRYVTVLFSDIRGFTAFAEQHQARDVLSLLNHFFKQMTEVIFRHNGTFDKYVGDEIMAFFGAPVATGQDTLNAVRAALELQAVFASIRDSLQRDDVRQLGLGIGLYSGEAAVGNVGSERVMSYTVIGDTVNTAHRLQAIALDGEIIAGETTFTPVSDWVDAAQHAPAIIRGKREPLTLYTILGLKETNV